MVLRATCCGSWGGTPLNDAVRHEHKPVIDFLKSVGALIGVQTEVKDEDAVTHFIPAPQTSEAEANENDVRSIDDVGDGMQLTTYE